ncbi:MAG TPA: flagellar hook-length control protein FliK [Terriglobales bacterium]|nr:flagellar hook-length control protein FliK [Terriglobales bacterium]
MAASVPATAPIVAPPATVSHAAAPAPAPATPAAPTAGATLPAWQNANAHAALSAAANGTMNVALHSDTLGTVQIHAAMQNNQFGATLTADRADAQHWIAAQLPALTRQLADRQIQVNSLQMQSQSSGSGGQSSSTPGQQQAPTSAFLPALPRSGSDAAAAPVPAAPHATPVSGGIRLNLRA